MTLTLVYRYPGTDTDVRPGDHVLAGPGAYAGTVISLDRFGMALVQHVCPCAGYPYKVEWGVEDLRLDPKCQPDNGV